MSGHLLVQDTSPTLPHGVPLSNCVSPLLDRVFPRVLRGSFFSCTSQQLLVLALVLVLGFSGARSSACDLGPWCHGVDSASYRED